MCCGANHSMLLTVTGQVCNNYDAKLKDKNAKKLGSSFHEPKKITFDNKNTIIVQIASGMSHHAALSQDGRCNIKNHGVKCFNHGAKSIASIPNELSLKHVRLVQQEINDETMQLRIKEEEKNQKKMKARHKKKKKKEMDLLQH